MSSVIYDSELLKYIFNNANVGIAICNAKDNRLEMVNPTFAKIHGYEQHELIGAMPGEVFAPECMLKLSEHEKSPVCTINNDISFETTHIKKDGTLVNVSVHITIIKDENGEVKQRIANIIDISKRKNSERVFKDTNSKLEAIFSTIPDMVWMKDPNGKYIASNHTFNKVFDKSELEVIGKTDYDFFSKEEADSCKISDLEAVSAKKTIHCQETIIYPQSDKKGILEIRKTPVYDSANNLMGILGIARDVTDRKNAEEKLLMVNTAINSTSDAIYITDKDLSIIYVNNGACNMLGYTKDEFTSMNISDIDAKNSKDEIVDIKKEITDTNQIVFETKHKAKNGSVIDVEITGSSFIFEGKSVRISVVKDITERKIFEERLASKEREFRTLAQNANIPIYRYDKECRRIYVNPAVEKLSNKRVSDLLGKTPLESSLIHPDYNEALMTSLNKVLNTGENDAVELLFILPDGTKKYFLHHHVAEYNSLGEIESVLAIGHDITAQKELESREEMFRTLAENSPNIIMRYDGDAKRIYANPAFAKHTGIPLEQTFNNKPERQWGIYLEMLNMSAYDYQERVKKVFQTGKSDNFTVEWIRYHDGVKVAHDLNLVAEKDSKGYTLGVLAIGHDITKKLEIERKLKQSVEFTEGVINAIPDLLFEVDINGVYLNFWTHDDKLLSTYKDSLIGQKISDVLSFESTLVAYEAINEANIHGISFGKVYGLKLNDEDKWYELSVSKKANGTFLALARDVTERKLTESSLKESEQKFKSLTENLPDNIARWDLEGRYLYINPRHEKTLEMTFEDVVGKKMVELFGTHTNVTQALEYVQKNGEAVFGILQSVRYKNGLEEIHEVNIIPELDSNGNMVSILGIGRDITKQIKLQEELKIQKDFQDTLLKGVAKAGMSVNVLENGRYIYTNNIELAKEYGYDDNFLQNRPDFLETIHPEDKAKVAQIYQKRLSGEDVPTTYTIRQINKKGETKEHEVSVVLIPNTHPVQTLVVNKDVTEQKNIEKRIEFMAHHDILTGLPNRVLLKDRAEMILLQAKRNIKKTAFLFIDLDGFKTINDSLGHSIGDMVLKVVAQRIQGCIRATDTLSRYGGDEFIVIIPEVNHKDEAESVSEKIISEFKKSFEINNQVLSVTASVGIAMYPEHGNNFEHLLQNADAAMYKAKENGKNTYCFFTQQMKHNLLGIFKMQNDLKEAIRNKEFILHYQPQIDIAENKIVGAEALIRWKHPAMGMIPPMNFISIAESCGYIVEIGEWVINEACHQCAIWNQNGKDIVIAVNVSAVQFKRGNLIEVVKNALHSSGLDPKYLELELTESILISDTDNVLQSVKAIKELGVQLSIDDFGTGYSSLAYLKRFAVDKLKIDQSFVRDIVKDKEDSSIVKTIIQMAKSFNLKSIAEGVENEEVLHVLKEFGCDEVQGYHFAKPMVASDFRDYYKKLQTQRII
ncbi:MAG: PAS domain S-box protein [Arcobacteraceae bacterium]|jgi:diguanylate cyclase (GGDEF)-like protein/PAS domain S-box-containing protein|nr:PAS domain S-box protein [Arcobacteraceae bacterium]